MAPPKILVIAAGQNIRDHHAYTPYISQLQHSRSTPTVRIAHMADDCKHEMETDRADTYMITSTSLANEEFNDVLQSLARRLRDEGGTVVLCGLSAPMFEPEALKKILRQFGVNYSFDVSGPATVMQKQDTMPQRAVNRLPQVLGDGRYLMVKDVPSKQVWYWQSPHGRRIIARGADPTGVPHAVPSPFRNRVVVAVAPVGQLGRLAFVGDDEYNDDLYKVVSYLCGIKHPGSIASDDDVGMHVNIPASGSLNRTEATTPSSLESGQVSEMGIDSKVGNTDNGGQVDDEDQPIEADTDDMAREVGRPKSAFNAAAARQEEEALSAAQRIQLAKEIGLDNQGKWTWNRKRPFDFKYCPICETSWVVTLDDLPGDTHPEHNHHATELEPTRSIVVNISDFKGVNRGGAAAAVFGRTASKYSHNVKLDEKKRFTAQTGDLVSVVNALREVRKKFLPDREEHLCKSACSCELSQTAANLTSFQPAGTFAAAPPEKIRFRLIVRTSSRYLIEVFTKSAHKWQKVGPGHFVKPSGDLVGHGKLMDAIFFELDELKKARVPVSWDLIEKEMNAEAFYYAQEAYTGKRKNINRDNDRE